MGGTAVAATGGTFILGKANTARSVSSLTNTRGTALSLSSSSKAPPLKVSNSVQVPKLDASELGGVPAGDYMQGLGTATATVKTFTGLHQGVLLTSPGAELKYQCEPGLLPGTALFINGIATAAAGQTAVWWNPSGVAGDDALASGAADFVTPDKGTTTPYMVEVQVSDVSTVSTFIASDWYNATTNTCHFTGQVVTVKV
jgi:hypothetical protein